jgi:hypothetical protein
MLISMPNKTKFNVSLEESQSRLWCHLSETQQELIQGGAFRNALQFDTETASGLATGKRQHKPVRW